MGQFSDDGKWWWQGTAWVPTAQVVLPQLPTTEFERSGKLEIARGRMREAAWLGVANAFPPLAFVTGVPLIFVAHRAVRDYRSWRLEQLALATAHLLGPNEPMLAGEATMREGPQSPDDSAKSYLAVAVTAAHALVFRIDYFDGQPRWIALAGRPPDVTIEYVRPFHSARILEATGRPEQRTETVLFGPALIVSGGNGQWAISGWPGLFKAQPVLDAWRQAGNATSNTG